MLTTSVVPSRRRRFAVCWRLRFNSGVSGHLSLGLGGSRAQLKSLTLVRPNPYSLTLNPKPLCALNPKPYIHCESSLVHILILPLYPVPVSIVPNCIPQPSSLGQSGRLGPKLKTLSTLYTTQPLEPYLLYPAQYNLHPSKGQLPPAPCLARPAGFSSSCRPAPPLCFHLQQGQLALTRANTAQSVGAGSVGIAFAHGHTTLRPKVPATAGEAEGRYPSR